MENVDKREILSRLMNVRAMLLVKLPFFGRLLMRLKFALADCETACTDMERIIFDPKFVARLSDGELAFVMQHEVLHCALQHCTRGKGKNPLIFNMAADIVVNSNILFTMLGRHVFRVDGQEPMHLLPNGMEGYTVNVEEAYSMLLEKYKAELSDENLLRQMLKATLGEGFDDHDIWSELGEQGNKELEEEWQSAIFDAAKQAGAMIVPPAAEKIVRDINYRAKLNWRELLQDFIQITHDRFDYSFAPTDRRFAGCDFIMPAFTEIEGEKVENLWFVVDSSGSMEDSTLAMVYQEIKNALQMFPRLAGYLSYFDLHVTKPVKFESEEELRDIDPYSRGGTSFHIIFDYLKDNQFSEESDKPTAIIILTDGYATYPEETVAMGIPVLWILVDNDEDEAPWGVTVHV